MHVSNVLNLYILNKLKLNLFLYILLKGMLFIIVTLSI